MKLYTASIKSFLSAPLFGIGDLVLKTVDNPREIVGGHSIVCDYLAYYGLVGSVLFHSILVTNFARIEKILDRRGRFLYLVVLSSTMCRSPSTQATMSRSSRCCSCWFRRCWF